MRLNSTAFSDRSAIPLRHTCDGKDLSPPFDWSGVPPGTRSLVLLCDDPDAPAGTWHHWAAYDIPADRRAVRRAPASTPNGKVSSRQSATSGGPATAVLARQSVMGRIIITSGCLRCRSIVWRCAKTRPAAMSSARRVSTSSPKRSSSASTSDDRSWPGQFNVGRAPLAVAVVQCRHADRLPHRVRRDRAIRRSLTHINMGARCRLILFAYFADIAFKPATDDTGTNPKAPRRLRRRQPSRLRGMCQAIRLVASTGTARWPAGRRAQYRV
jgi:hypothetical protein